MPSCALDHLFLQFITHLFPVFIRLPSFALYPHSVKLLALLPLCHHGFSYFVYYLSATEAFCFFIIKFNQMYLFFPSSL